jgi:hypothetical protein
MFFDKVLSVAMLGVESVECKDLRGENFIFNFIAFEISN